MKSFLVMVLTAASIIFHTSAMAEDCYREVEVKETELGCDKNSSSSADFSSGCNYGDVTKTVRVPVECAKSWMNAPAHWTRAQYMAAGVCEFYGMERSDFNGVICGSSTLQPQSGAGYQNINDHVWQAPGRGMGSYKILMVGGTHLLRGSLMSGLFCSNKPTWNELEAQGIHGSYVTAMVCKQKGKVD